MPSICAAPNNMSSNERTAQLDNTNLNMEFLELAGRSLDMRIVADNASSSFVEMSGVVSQHAPTVSGLNDFDYQMSGQVVGHQALSQLKTLSKVPLPPEVLEHFGHMQCHCMMGLFPEINRGWLTIDSNIYVWAYEHGTDVAYFDGLGETIISVGLIKPKPGVFQNFVKYLLILTTNVEIVVLGVTFSSGSNNGPLGALEEMHLVPEPVFVLPTDGVSMNVIQSTNTGRIFMGGKDGCLYEITYQAQLGWFGKHCKKVNHSTGTLSFLVPSFFNVALYEDDPISKIDVDNSRGILYTLSEKGSIEVYDLGLKGDSIKKVVKLSQSKIVHMATDIVKTLESANFRPIISISAIEESESIHLNVIAITQCGVRLYFTTGCVFVSGNGITTQRPYCLTLLHVRLPPGFAANAPMIRPKQVHTATYNNGTALLISTASADSELLWCLSGSGISASGGSMGREVAAILSLDGPAWALRRATSALPNLSPALQLAAEPSIVSQHMSGPIKWVALTGTGAHIIQQLLPVDVLRQLLIESQGCDSPQVKAFFQVQREDQACASCLVLACGGSSSMASTREHIAEWATRAYFLYGGQPTLLQHQSLNFPGSPQFAPRQMSTPMVGRSAANVHQSLQAAVQSPEADRHLSPAHLNRPRQATPAQENVPFPTMHFSPKHEGLYIYVGRILRPLWQMKCVTKSTVDTKDFLSSNVTSGDCASVLQYLYGVRAFLEKNSVGSIGSMGRPTILSGPLSADSNLNTTRQEDVFIKEKQSLEVLRVFINGSCEMLSLWKILCEHQFHVIAACLPPSQQSALLAASFRELLIGGQEVAGLLILSLINQYLTDNASVDSISSELREVCPNLYRREDAACSKANEILLFAKQQSSALEREEMLCNALKLCKDVAPHVNLPVVCAKFSQAGFYKGVVDLCVTCADKIDPTKTGLHFYRNDQPHHDQEGYLAFYKRMDVYREVTGVLEQLFEQSSGGSSADGLSGATSTTSPNKSPSSAPQDLPNLSPADANYQARKLVMECLTYPDELLHVAVYEWMLTKQLYGELISVAEPSLEAYLIRTSQNNPDAVHVFDLLWKYYEKCGNHAAAARILDSLASKQSSNMKLTQRVNWLSRAVVCLRGGAGASPGAGRLLRELEEKADVARLQRLVLSAIVRLPNVPSAVVSRLENALLDITQLYEEFADKYDLWECKLAIVHCSGHNDPLLVESIWTNIIQQELDSTHWTTRIGLQELEGRTSNDNRMMGLLSKISSLGKEYAGSGPCFPLSFILRQLELQSCKLKADPGLVSKTLLDINVPMEQLIDIYTRLIGLNERVWLSEGNELHLIEAAAILMDQFANNTVPLSAHLRRKVLIKCQDLVSSSLNSLYTKPDTDELIKVLKGMQTKLERME